MNRLENKVALITGAGQGIGKGVARRFAAEGASIVIAEIAAANGEMTAREIVSDFAVAADFVRTDVSDKESVLGAVDFTARKYGRVDILVNNAWAGGGYGPVEKKTDAQMEKAYRIGVMGAFWAMQAVFPHMRRHKWGRIISMCSLNGVNAHMFTAEYNVVKEGLRSLTRTVAREWAQHNILANIICPGAATPAYEYFAKNSPENAAALLRQNPMGRMGDAEKDIGGVALFLASEDSCYVTGNTIFADGGSHINGVSWSPQLPE
jgi:NAD(P)-dependent dehydrogenase (short-subunit alcohol dehydrogenase family)